MVTLQDMTDASKSVPRGFLNQVEMPCIQLPGCSFCPRFAVGPELQACYNSSKFPSFCRNRGAQTCTRQKERAVHDVVDVGACQRLCEMGGASGNLCRVPLVPWLLRDPNGTQWFTEGTFPRMDVLLKAAIVDAWIRNESQLDDSYSAYIVKRTGVHAWGALRLQVFRGLFASVRERGFDWLASPIVLHPDYTIQDGSHRVALALALGWRTVVIAPPKGCGTGAMTTAKASNRNAQDLRYMRRVVKSGDLLTSMRRLGSEWLFVSPGALAGTGVASADGHSASSVASVDGRSAASAASSAEPTRFVAILWGCGQQLWSSMASRLRHAVAGTVSAACVARPPSLEAFVRGVYAVDDVSPANLRTKLSRLSRCSKEVALFNLSVAEPRWRLKANGNQLSQTMEMLKANVRGKFKGQVANYTHDILFHVGDNFAVHTRHLDNLTAPLQCSDKIHQAAQPPASHRRADLPDIAAFLVRICEIPHLVIKTDGQPQGFPLAINAGGDVDILTTPQHFASLQAATRELQTRRPTGQG